MRRHPVLVFLLLVLAFSTPFYLLLNLSGGRGEGMRLYVTALMWCPALAALLACRAGGIALASLGWRWPGQRLLWGCYLLPLLYGLLAYAFIWTSGLGAFSTEAYAAYAGKSLGLAALPPSARMALMLGLQASAGFVLSCASALGEEIGWRGFLAPRLLARFGFAGGSVATGLLWSLWHVPVLFWLNYYGEVPRGAAFAFFALTLVAISFVFSWLRLRSGSLWPAVVLHASHNVFITPVLTMLTADTGPRTAWAVDETGFALTLACALLASWCWRRRGEATASAQAV
jgi:membrane protease YdiL (CAAX protease family)